MLDSDKKDGNSDKVNSLVSLNNLFEFGFFEKDNGEFVVGIRYSLGLKSANLGVWSVGGGVRVLRNSTFKLLMDGRLTLFENPSNALVWSSDTANLGVEKVTLLDNGNLVLMGSENSVIWESFSRPTNTLLPGQILHYPQNLRAPSTKSVTSYYTFVVHPEGLALMWESNITYWRTQLSLLSATVKEVRFDSNGVLGLYDDAKKIVWSVSSKDFGESSVSLRHVRMDKDGNLRIYSWDDGARSWKVGWQAVEDQCNVLGNAFPSPDSGGSGCKKMVDLGNCKAHTSMLAMKQTNLYGLYPPHDIDMMLSEEACKAYCVNDTTCVAMTSKNDGSGLCTLKRTTFISGSTSPSIPSTSYLKVCQVPQAVAAKGANPNVTPKAKSFPFQGNSRKILSAIAFVILVTVLVLLVLELFIVLFVYNKKQNNSQNRVVKGAKAKLQNSPLVRLSFKEIQELTSNFSTQLGSSVFKGLLPDEMTVVAKVLDFTVESEKEFLKGVSILGGTHHRNLVSLQGFCFDPNHKVLIYECVPDGSADKWLFDVHDGDNKQKNWQQRVDIAVGVTRALMYLHTECQLCIPHGSCSSSNESASEKDIYMLGKMLIEIVLLSRDAVGDSLDQVMDKVMQEQKYLDSEDLRGVERVVRIALWCMQTQPFLRPSVGEVMKVLEGTLSVDRPPSSFAYRNVDDTDRTVPGVSEIRTANPMRVYL
ncbi:G-type lectin S-receptor-like serine/threonine-protein kinase SD3-1 [Tanacetum coccineum]